MLRPLTAAVHARLDGDDAVSRAILASIVIEATLVPHVCSRWTASSAHHANAFPSCVLV